jgi:hypothetical protein
MAVLKGLNLALAFILELCMLAALGYWGFNASDSTVLRLLLGFGVPLVVILIWARWLAPRSATRLKGAAYLGLKTLIFGVAAVALAAAGQVTPAIVLACVFVINQALGLLWKQGDMQPAQVEA